MEIDKKRKNNHATADDNALKKLKKAEDQEAAAGASTAVPMEEEVDEFFAILRRMKVVVNYFDRKGRSGGKEWKEVLEQAELAVDDAAAEDRCEADGASVKKNPVVEGFDLNAAAPEAADA